MISDENGGATPKPRKALVRLSDAQWVAARHQYETETCSDARSVERIMAGYDVSERTVRAKIASQGWKKGIVVADQAATKLHQLIEEKLPAKADQIVERLSSKVEADMAPWFEKEKRRQTKNSIRLVKSRQRMLDSIVDKLGEEITPKDAAYVAKGDDTYDAIARRNLGMSEGSDASGSLSIRLLTQGAAIEINQA